jgi:hypothetical protein
MAIVLEEQVVLLATVLYDYSKYYNTTMRIIPQVILVVTILYD